jgi:hypothetical protein
MDGGRRYGYRGSSNREVVYTEHLQEYWKLRLSGLNLWIALQSHGKALSSTVSLDAGPRLPPIRQTGMRCD